MAAQSGRRIARGLPNAASAGTPAWSEGAGISAPRLDEQAPKERPDVQCSSPEVPAHPMKPEQAKRKHYDKEIIMVVA
jgi:hypothetical protein